MTDEMNLDIKEQLGNEAYSTLIEVKEVFEKERDECKKSWGNFISESKLINNEKDDLFCPDCASELVIITDTRELDCRTCGEIFDHETVVEAVVKRLYEYDNYISVKDGGELSSTKCPECNQEALIVEDLTCACCG